MSLSVRSAVVRASSAAVLSLSLSSCVVPIVAGGAASTGYVVGQERDVSTQVSDTVIRTGINDKWLRFSSDMAHQLSLSVYDGRVLIVGVVANPEWKTDAVRLAWEVKGVKEVNSEIELSSSQGIGDTARDELITTRLRSAILLDGQIRSVNYTIDTINGSVILSGSARSQAELDKVTNYARNIPNVKRVVSYVRIRVGEPAVPSGSAVSSGSTTPAGNTGPPAGATQDVPQSTPQTISVPQAAPSNVPPPPATPGGPAKIEVQPLQ